MRRNTHRALSQNGEKYMETSSRYYEENLYNQIEEAFGKVVYTYTTHIIQAGRIQEQNRTLKWVQVIVSAISTGGFLATVIANQVALAWISGICSILLLVLSSYFKEMDLTEKQKNHLQTSNKLWSIREDYLSLLVDFPKLEPSAVALRRDELKNLVSKIYDEAPITDSKSYELARKALKENESQYFTREELNQILPNNLRK